MVKILYYGDCKSVVFKHKLYSDNIEKFDIILWYELTEEINYNNYIGYDILICDSTPSKCLNTYKDTNS